MLNRNRDLFLKNQSGHLISIQSYLFLNFTHKQEIVFIFNQNKTWVPHESMEEGERFGFLLCKDNLYVDEISDTIPEICGLTLEGLKVLKDDSHFGYLDLMFTVEENDLGLKNMIE
jgi:hypothetical protein